MKEYNCPNCNRKNRPNKAIALDEKDTRYAPRPGDITICSWCLNWNVFDGNTQPREITEDELIELSDEHFAILTKASKLLAMALKAAKEAYWGGYRKVPKNTRVAAMAGQNEDEYEDEDVVNLYGFGVYVGDEIPPPDANPIINFGEPNPKIILDDGTIIWGCECWWAEESMIKNKIKPEKIHMVDIHKIRREYGYKIKRP